MKVWIVNPFDNLPQEGTRPQRYWLMARAWVRRGAEVVYWTADFSHAHKRPRAFTAQVNDGFALKLVHEPAYHGNICLGRVWAHWRLARNFLSAARRECLKPEKSPDLVIVSSPPLTLVAAARKICRLTGAKLIVDVQDAWPETFYRVLPAWVLSPLKALARRNYLAADAITAVSSRYLEMVREYGATCPTHLCYHGIDGGTAALWPPSNPMAAFRLVYVGNMSLSYDLATVIDVVKGMDGVELELAGTGPNEAALKMRAADCPRIRFHGYLAERPLREFLDKADAGVVPMFTESCVGIPGKLADYVAAGLPILNSLAGEAAQLIAEHGAGAYYEAGNADSLRKVLADWAESKRTDSVEWSSLRHAVGSLAAVFDASLIYGGYCDFVDRMFRRSNQV